MRYQLPIYAGLAIIAAWVIFKLWENGEVIVRKITQIQVNWRRVLAVVLVIIVAGCTAAWAYAFTRIYTRPVTRVAASEWIYQNIPGAINLKIDTSSGDVNEPIAYLNGAQITPETPYIYDFSPVEDADLTSVSVDHVLLQNPQGGEATFFVTVSQLQGNSKIGIASGSVQSNFAIKCSRASK